MSIQVRYVPRSAGPAQTRSTTFIGLRKQADRILATAQEEEHTKKDSFVQLPALDLSGVVVWRPCPRFVGCKGDHAR
jgi:hypothetical protein